jgi:hypothetical protein
MGALDTRLNDNIKISVLKYESYEKHLNPVVHRLFRLRSFEASHISDGD